MMKNMYIPNIYMMKNISAQFIYDGKMYIFPIYIWWKICLPNKYTMNIHLSNFYMLKKYLLVFYIMRNIFAQFIYDEKYKRPLQQFWVYVHRILEISSEVFSYLVFYLLGETTQSMCRLIFQSSLASLINIPGWNCTFEEKGELIDICRVVLSFWVFVFRGAHFM